MNLELEGGHQLAIGWGGLLQKSGPVDGGGNHTT